MQGDATLRFDSVDLCLRGASPRSYSPHGNILNIDRRFTFSVRATPVLNALPSDTCSSLADTCVYLLEQVWLSVRPFNGPRLFRAWSQLNWLSLGEGALVQDAMSPSVVMGLRHAKEDGRGRGPMTGRTARGRWPPQRYAVPSLDI